ncbi:F-box protein At5g49610 [Malania oleifera]|uniref:F-box protein At5g49610 n=1 Tax=Malania oleifera TaxID=397392 RepID=UPI0025AEC9F3|nr:F-box protein At5g49610 [Malania oleifera]XP_057950379.1 F-box protein At5g49610 [Malania oleifera]XP_057950380.1 F-box protein At5g49610 [Malania oleifera]XP_057950381.1 F-box protein At5g49610 [Malania oleifera]XP_057950382.1 F-box protein At5g49610 [Malania oleifera]XP_057950383.1 F-box protein At5g49610 [Malania oleifera]XP_057950384.1 F-box protein At5g49610 [Malania oleifera]XP_057950386.1 F-box protein At5g49610 [Malania oleifera]XP_057950387.1 F-box protein At5g49610 [Malania ole
MDETGRKRIQVKDDNWAKLKFVEDIMTNIFLRLPVKSIVICKAACKHWRKFVRDPHFVNAHLKLSKQNIGYIIHPCIGASKDFYLMNGDDGVITERISLPGLENLSSVRLICSFNGLICCVGNASPSADMIDLNILICNPATREVLLLPRAASSREEYSIGLAFDRKTNEYKVFWFFNAARKSHHKHYKCEIYSSITGSWKSIGSVAHFPMRSLPIKCCPLSSSHVCIDGTAYWFISSKDDPSIPGSILAVDMEENFRTVSLPQDVTELSFLVELEGFLSLVSIYIDEKIVQTWILFDEFDQTTWWKERADHIPIDDPQCYFTAALRHHEIFFITSSCYLIYNLENGLWKDIDLWDPLGTNYASAFAYIESLLPCNGRMDSRENNVF